MLRDKVSYYSDPKNKSVVYAKVGSAVIFETRECFNEEIKARKTRDTDGYVPHEPMYWTVIYRRSKTRFSPCCNDRR